MNLASISMKERVTVTITSVSRWVITLIIVKCTWVEHKEYVQQVVDKERVNEQVFVKYNRKTKVDKVVIKCLELIGVIHHVT